MAKTKKQLKQDQAIMQPDVVDMYSEGLVMSGPVMSTDLDFSYSYGDLGDMGQLDLFNEMDMRDKYPALKQAHEHYQSVLEVCKTKEKEENED